MGDNAFAGISLGYNSQNIFKYRDEKMCGKWNTVDKFVGPCKVKIYGNPYGNIVVHGVVNKILKGLNISNPLYVKYWAANCPTYSYSFSGSGMPFPTEKIAFQDTNNKGVAQIRNGEFSFNILYQNSYRKNMGKVYVPPQVKVQFCSKDNNLSGVYEINLGNGIPFRNVEMPRKRDWKTGPMFYCNVNLPVRTQAQILRDSAYPCVNQEPPNFWGTKPPC